MLGVSPLRGAGLRPAGRRTGISPWAMRSLANKSRRYWGGGGKRGSRTGRANRVRWKLEVVVSAENSATFFSKVTYRANSGRSPSVIMGPRQ